MKKISVVVAVVLMGLFSLGSIADAAGHRSASDPADQARKQGLSAAAVGAGSYLKEIYTTLDQPVPINQSAIRVFFPGDKIAFVGRVFLANPSAPLYVVTIITNVGGQTVFLDSYSYNPDSANYIFEVWEDTLPVGTYFFNLLVLASDGILMPTAAFPFSVQ